MNQEDQLFLDSEYLFDIQSFNIKLERVTEQGYLKLFPSEVMNVRLGRSIIQFFHSISLSIINEQSLSSFPCSVHSPSWMEFKFGRPIKYSNHSNT